MSEKHQDKERERNQTTREVLRDSSAPRETSEQHGGVTPIDEASGTSGTNRTREEGSGLTTKSTVTGSDMDGQAI